MASKMTLTCTDLPCLACSGKSVDFCRLPGKFDATGLLTKKDDVRYQQCLDCGTIQQNPVPDPNQLSGLVSAEYASSTQRLQDSVSTSATLAPQHEFIANVIRDYGIREHVLDIGAGTGNLCALLLARNIQCRGIELSPQLVVYAREKGLPVELGNVMDMDGENIYSAITMSHVFEHLSDPEGAMIQIRSLLKPGGLFLSVQPTAGMTNFLSRLLRLNNLHHQSNFRLSYLNLNAWHIAIFSIKGMKELANRCGFEVVKVLPMPSIRSTGIIGLTRFFYQTFNVLGEKAFPQKWPFQVAHLFIFRKMQSVNVI